MKKKLVSLFWGYILPETKKAFRGYQEGKASEEFAKLRAKRKGPRTPAKTGLVEITMEAPGRSKPTTYMVSEEEFQELKEFLCGSAVQ